MENKFLEIKANKNQTFIPYSTITRVVVRKNDVFVTTGNGLGAQSYSVKDEETIQKVMNYINS